MTTKLPVIGSTAATTAFCSAKIEGPQGTYLYVDGNGKITRDNGTLKEPRPNAFSLVQIETCPQSTPTCQKSCYAHNLETAQGAVHDLYKHNTVEIRRILADVALANEWVILLAQWLRDNVTSFRWHVSGDVFSHDYARFIADVCRESPTVEHWIYTRSFKYIAPLVEVSTARGGNLALNLSCDADNYELAKRTSGLYIGLEHPERLRLCYLTTDGKLPDDLPESSVVFPDYNLRPRQFATLAESPWWQEIDPAYRKMVCPVDAHGKAENRRCGPCDRCLT